jgi:hypothetical protein
MTSGILPDPAISPFPVQDHLKTADTQLTSDALATGQGIPWHHNCFWLFINIKHKVLSRLSYPGGIAMTVTEMSTSTVNTFKRSLTPAGFYSVEFALDEPHPLYQFKIWRSESSPMFVVVKENSAVLPKLKAGSVLNMTYYSSDAQCPKKQIETRIGPISSERKGRFQGHCTIDLVPVN